MSPVTIPPNGVLTPLALFTVDRPNDAVTGREPANDPTNWQIPRARISCVESMLFVGAEIQKQFQIIILLKL